MIVGTILRDEPYWLPDLSILGGVFDSSRFDLGNYHITYLHCLTAVQADRQPQNNKGLC